MKNQVAICMLFLVAALGVPSPASAGPVQYLYSPFPSLPGGRAGIPFGENNAGQIVGDSLTPTGARAVLYSNGVLTELAGFTSVARAINDSGQIVGYGYSPITGRPPVQAFSFGTSGAALLPQLPGTFASQATAINSSGTAVGFAVLSGHSESYTLYQSGSVSAIPLPSGERAFSYPSINDAGLVAGTVSDSSGDNRGFAYNSVTGSFNLLNPLPGDPDSWGLGVNNRGDVLGYSFKFGGDENIGVWDPSGKFHTYFTEGIPSVPTLSNNLLFNDLNQIVITETTDGTSYLVDPLGVRTNLASLTVNLPTGFRLEDVTAINDNGTIVGLGFTSTGAESGFILTPTPEPSSLTLLGLGGLIMAGMWRRRRRSLN